MLGLKTKPIPDNTMTKPIILKEIRTPMNAMFGFLQLLYKTKVDDEQKLLISQIKKGSKNLLCTINDILDITKIEEGKMVLERIQFDLMDGYKATKMIIEKIASLKLLVVLKMEKKLLK